MNEQIMQARQMSGEMYRGLREQLPFIKFMSRGSSNGKENMFYLLKKDKENKDKLVSTELGGAIDVVILKIRKGADNGQGTPEKFLYEYDDPMATLSLKVENQIESGTWAELKAAHPDLKYKEILYVLYNGEICKMKLGAAHLQHLWDYLATFGADDTVMRFTTTLAGEKVEHVKGAYYAITFTRGAENGKFDEILATMRSLVLPSGPKQKLLDAPATGTAIDGDDEINVEDIPF